MVIPLTPAECQAALNDLPGWRMEADAIVKTFEFRTFREAMSFILRVSYEAEAMNHHPEWTNQYGRVAVRLSTHDAGGKVTLKDQALAQKIQALSWVG
ncbi:MAG: 4a-hydroxytetrahydrobiopterin dehydratase [Opitutae bacterium]|nr:4a-hydroxytetrahydrobiopterin dehydratase [Opitutae bacterium]